MTRPIFPNLDFVARLIANNEVWAEENQSNLPIHEDKKPLGIVEGKIPIVLARNSSERLVLGQWVPPVLQSTKINLIYSSDHHGRSIEMFYLWCSSSRHTITVMKYLGQTLLWACMPHKHGTTTRMDMGTVNAFCFD